MRQPAWPIKVADSVGDGDALAVGVIDGLRVGNPLGLAGETWHEDPRTKP